MLISQVNPVLFAAVSLEVFGNSPPVLAGTQFLRLRLEAWFLCSVRRNAFLSLPPPLSPHPTSHITATKLWWQNFIKCSFGLFFIINEFKIRLYLWHFPDLKPTITCRFACKLVTLNNFKLAENWVQHAQLSELTGGFADRIAFNHDTVGITSLGGSGGGSMVPRKIMGNWSSQDVHSFTLSKNWFYGYLRKVAICYGKVKN